MGEATAMTGLEGDAREAYANFATREARGNSPFYEEVCRLIVDDDDLLRRIAALSGNKRQPNLVLGAARYLGAPETSASIFVDWMREHWAAVVGVVMTRMTQTNEVGRCATLLPFIAEVGRRVGGPIALVEVGCSAGLALYPNLYRYRYVSQESPEDEIAFDGRSVPSGVRGRGDADRRITGPELVCTVSGPGTWKRLETLTGLPPIAWRGGLDLNPLDVVSDTDDARDTLRWLQALVWPGQETRARRLTQAAAAVRDHVAAHPAEAPHVIAGDVVGELDRLLERVPEGMPIVVFHSAVLAYVEPATRAAFEERMHALAERAAGFTWISNEAPGVMPGIATRLAERQAQAPDVAGRFVLAVDGMPRALTGPHGQSLELL